MDSEHIESLLARYVQAEISPEEEKELRQLLSSPDVPAHLSSVAAMFAYFKEEASRNELGEEFNREVLAFIKDSESRKSRKNRWWKVSGIAAGVMIAASLVFSTIHNTSTPQDTFTDPKKAYEETQRILMTISEKFNEGASQMQKLEVLQDAQDIVESKQQSKKK